MEETSTSPDKPTGKIGGCLHTAPPGFATVTGHLVGWSLERKNVLTVPSGHSQLVHAASELTM